MTCRQTGRLAGYACPAALCFCLFVLEPVWAKGNHRTTRTIRWLPTFVRDLNALERSWCIARMGVPLCPGGIGRQVRHLHSGLVSPICFPQDGISLRRHICPYMQSLKYVDARLAHAPSNVCRVVCCPLSPSHRRRTVYSSVSQLHGRLAVLISHSAPFPRVVFPRARSLFKRDPVPRLTPTLPPFPFSLVVTADLSWFCFSWVVAELWAPSYAGPRVED